jgi:hypothetical protein
LEFSFSRDERGVANGDAGDIGDSVERAGRAVERDAEVAGARFCDGFLLSMRCER